MNKQASLFKKNEVTQNNPSITFEIGNGFISKKTQAGGYCDTVSLPISHSSTRQDINLAHLWALEELNQTRSPQYLENSVDNFNIVDLFCGTGGLTLGVKRALNSLGINSKVLFACDADDKATDVYNWNHRPKKIMHENVLNLLENTKHSELDGFVLPDLRETRLIDELDALIGSVDVFLAGPPCEGHSNLNNKTRRVDPRNELYVLSTQIGIALDAKILIIENVPQVLRSKQNVIERSKILLNKHGYDIKNCEFLLASENHLISQTRKRHFLIAVKNEETINPVSLEGVSFPSIPVVKVLENLDTIIDNNPTLDEVSRLSEENQARINFLHKSGLRDLPDEHRPDCHRLKEHNYGSVYGRMLPNEPAPTLTTGFLSPGRGRYIHPVEARSLTIREGARIQGFPAYFKWLPPSQKLGKTSLSRLIGDAVPPNLGATAALLALAMRR